MSLTDEAVRNMATVTRLVEVGNGWRAWQRKSLAPDQRACRERKASSLWRCPSTARSTARVSEPRRRVSAGL